MVEIIEIGKEGSKDGNYHVPMVECPHCNEDTVIDYANQECEKCGAAYRALVYFDSPE
jgi:hypothetical protein